MQRIPHNLRSVVLYCITSEYPLFYVEIITLQYTVCNGYFTKSMRIYNLSHYLGFFTSICEELRYDGVLNCDKSHNMRLYITERKLCYHKSQSPHLACVNSPALCHINAGGDNAGMSQNVSEAAQIITTGLAGGLLTPYKGLLPALESKDSSNGSPAATSFTY